MFLKITVILSILLGAALGIYTSKSKENSIQRENTLVKNCRNQKEKNDLFETKEERRCVTSIANVGDKFKKSDIDAQKSVQEKFFHKHFNIERVRPDEFHIYFKKSKDGRIRRYDPRLDVFSRFRVRSLVKNNRTIQDYSVYSKKVVSVKNSMKELSCKVPKLSKILDMEGLSFFIEYRSNQYIDKTKVKKSRVFEREKFSAFQELDKKIGWYMYFVYNQNKIENFLLANHCNKSIALVLGHCIVDPRYDMQLEEIFWFKENNQIGINIYCKSSSKEKWNLINTKVLDKR